MKRFSGIERRASTTLKRFRALVSPPSRFSTAEAALVARLQGEDVLRPRDEALRVELLDPLFAEPLDIKGVAGDEMLQPLPRPAPGR